MAGKIMKTTAIKKNHFVSTQLNFINNSLKIFCECVSVKMLVKTDQLGSSSKGLLYLFLKY